MDVRDAGSSRVDAEQQCHEQADDARRCPTMPDLTGGSGGTDSLGGGGGGGGVALENGLSDDWRSAVRGLQPPSTTLFTGLSVQR